MEIVQASAAPISAEEHQQLVERSYALEQEVKKSLDESREVLWRTAHALYEFNEARGWSYLGGYDTLGDWLADPDIGMTRSTYYRMVETWREVIVMRQIDPGTVEDVDLSKVALALPAVKDGREDIDDAIYAARTNGWRDMRERYRIVPRAARGSRGRRARAVRDRHRLRAAPRLGRDRGRRSGAR